MSVRFHLQSERGSALLVALLLMGFLAVFGVGMSRLIVHSVRVERNVVEAGKAYFAAEAAIERGLYAHENRLPGYQVQDDGGASSEWTLSNGALVRAKTQAVGSFVPCASNSDWRALEVQESVSWPLFRWDADKGRVEVEKFTLQFEADPSVIGQEVLRWKILGLTEAGDTQAISGLERYDSVSNGFTQDSQANFYARSGVTFVNFPAYPIDRFIREHRFNYLTLTNVTASPALKVRLELPENESAACEFTRIRATGESGGTRQNIDVVVKLDSPLPVFNFVLYQTGP